MDNIEYMNLARRALNLYDLTNDIQKLLWDTFSSEFVTLDEHEQKRQLEEQQPLNF